MFARNAALASLKKSAPALLPVPTIPTASSSLPNAATAAKALCFPSQPAHRACITAPTKTAGAPRPYARNAGSALLCRKAANTATCWRVISGRNAIISRSLSESVKGAETELGSRLASTTRHRLSTRGTFPLARKAPAGTSSPCCDRDRCFLVRPGPAQPDAPANISLCR